MLTELVANAIFLRLIRNGADTLAFFSGVYSVHKNYLIAVVLMLVSACQDGEKKADYDPAHDYFSFANSKQFVTRHLELDLDVDFDNQILSGNAILHMERLDPGAITVVLDSRGLQISSIHVSAGGR